ncbi:MAG: hypothetical protein OEW77_07940 [Gemmatimonadota bacterium]|nr:hypothetical protein [Gemmatimonadota bacterium]
MTKTERNDKKKPDTAATAADGMSPESLDQVRDILFGGQMRTVETRLRSVEERLSREQQALRTELLKKLETLDAFARRETQALHERVAAESDARVTALKALTAEIKEAQKAMDKRHAELEKATSLSDAELRDQLIAQSRSASAELGKVHDRLKAEVTKSVDELQHAKTDRAALAALFTDVATRLGDGPAKGGRGGKGGKGDKGDKGGRG